MIELAQPNFDQLFWEIEPEQWNKMQKTDYYFDANICPESLTCGWGIYENLAKIIPIEYEIYDFGCSYAFQSWYFRNHKKYHGIDFDRWGKGDARYKTPNSIHYNLKIIDWIKYNINTVKQDESFAIINYVPPWDGDNQKIVRENFKNVFAFYP